MKRIIVFSPHYLPHLGGVERYTFNLARELVRKGNQVFVVCSNTENWMEHEITDEIEVFRIPCWNLLNGRFPIIKPFRQWREIKELLAKEKPDCVIVNTRFYTLSLLGVRFAEKHHIPAFVIEHGTNHFTINNMLFDKIGHAYEHWITRQVKRSCNQFYGVSQACNEWLKHYKIQASGVMYNAIHLDDIFSLTENPVQNYRIDFGLPEDAFVITYTGRLVEEKGIMRLIGAVQRLLETDMRFYLFIAGSGDLFDTVKAMNISNIILLGRIGFDHIVALLKQSDVFCLPTDYPEGFPTSVLEAAACKCFIITSESGGSKELIINRDYGIILSSTDIDSIYHAIQSAATDPLYKNAAAENAFKRLQNHFTWDKTGNAVLSAIENNN